MAKGPPRVLKDRYPGPYCLECEDGAAGEECLCRGARCAVPRCSRKLAESIGAPVPAGMLTWRVHEGLKSSTAIVEPGWVCSPGCLFAYVRARQDGITGRETAEQAMNAIILLQAPYLGLLTLMNGGPKLDDRLWDVISAEQIHTIYQAAQFANMAAMP